MAFGSNIERLRTLRPPLFIPTVVRGQQEIEESPGLNFSDSSQEEGLSIGSTGSFKYNIQGTGLQSTQQLNVNYGEFSNHTFFNSAQVKTNVAFDKIVNNFPFDGTKNEHELFFGGLTGFEKYVYDQFLKNKGYLFFSGSAPGVGSDDGTMVVVKDSAGSQFLELSRLKTGETVLDPGLSSMTIEMQLYVPSQSLGNLSQSIITKQSGSNNGFAVVLESLTGSSLAGVSFLAVSGAYEDKVTLNLEREAWNHIHWAWDRSPGTHTVYGYLNGKLETSSSMPIEFGSLGTGQSDMLIGSGSSLGALYTPNSTFSGSIDELRIWHSLRTKKQIEEFKTKSIFADDNLKLYYRFNEPSGSNTNLVLDYSKNSLHGRLNTRALTLGVREILSASGDTPMFLERLEFSPVLFLGVEGNAALRENLLLSASIYDEANPNLISKLIPRHYLEEGQYQDSLSTEEGEIVTTMSGSEPRNTTMGSTQVLLSLLYTWAKFFDEMKLYIQNFGFLNKIGYDETDTVPNDFLSAFARREGIQLPSLFVGTTIEQFIEGENLDTGFSTNILGLQNIQNQIWRRILINLQDVLKSKGTIHSIKSFIRSAGIDPDSNFRIREYGGPTKRPLSFNREHRFEVSTMLDFVSGGLITSPYLSSSRVEPGVPLAGPSQASNALLTSGSFSVEGIYRFIPSMEYPASQSLARLELSSSSGINILANLVASSEDSSIKLYTAPDSSAARTFMLPITGVDIFDGKQWHISFGRQRNDYPGLNSDVSSSYFLRAAKQNNGEILEAYTTSSYFADFPSTSRWQNATGSIVGPMLVVGSSSLTLAPSDHLSGSDEQTRSFKGRIGQIRFWSKYLTEEDWLEHVLNYRSVGVRDPKKNFNFASVDVSGSYERLRIDASTDQIVLSSDSSGSIEITDFSQNEFHLSGTGFPISQETILPEHFYFSYLSPKIDEGTTENKVRIRGLQSLDTITQALSPWIETSPVYEINPNEEATDSPKLSIDFSIVDSLDQDIITIFSSLDELNNVLGNPELQFACGYKELDIIRDLYFNKLKDKINLKGFFEFYKWFDTNMGTFVAQLIPRKTRFLGCNYIIESSICERAKYDYKFEDIYLGEDIRSGLRDSLLLQLIEGHFNRY
jgi:hypothetical protein